MTTVNYQVGASADDGLEIWGGSPDITATGIHLSGADDYAGFRFQSVAVPQGATINSATLSAYNLDQYDVTMEANIYGEDADDAAAFTTTNGNIDGRTLTTASVEWSTTLNFGDWTDSPDIATVIQEIVDRPGWSSGNDLVILLVSNASADAKFRTYDNTSERGAKLTIDYTEGGSSSIVVLRRRRM